MNIPKITIKLDHGYHPNTISTERATTLSTSPDQDRSQLAEGPTKAEKAAGALILDSYGQPCSKIVVEDRGSPIQGCPYESTENPTQGKAGFVPVATRWIIERSNAWMERCKSSRQKL